jgi:hypothetical protein
MARQLSHKARRDSVAARDLLYHPETRTAPEFEDEGARLDEHVRRLTNAHPETEWEDMRRLGPVGHLDPNLAYDSPDSFTMTKPGFAPRVRGQVFNQIGERAGTMSFSSLLEPARDDDRLNVKLGRDEAPAPLPLQPRRTAIPRAKSSRGDF